MSALDAVALTFFILSVYRHMFPARYFFLKGKEVNKL
jgi:hypothetical protein